MRVKLLFIVLAILTGSIPVINAQEVVSSATLENDSMMIGDQLKINLEFTAPGNTLVAWPELKDTITQGIEIINKSEIDSTYIDEVLKLSQDITITSFDSGFHEIPPFSFQYHHQGDTKVYINVTRPLWLNVHTLAVDTSQAIKPIKAPIMAPVTFQEVLPWLLIGIGSVAVLVLVIYYFIRKKQARPLLAARPKPKLPAHIIALNELEKLKQRKLWQAGQLKGYYTELTDIVRIYIEDRFGIDAMEMTTHEIIRGLPVREMTEDIVDRLEQTLTLADLVKFAKEKPLPTDNDSSWVHAKNFVEKTIKKQPMSPEQENGGQEAVMEKKELLIKENN